MQRKIEIEHITKLEKDTSLLIFDTSIVVELSDRSQCEDKKLTFNSFDNRDEVLDCITSIWQAQSPHARDATETVDNENEPDSSDTDL